VISIADATIDDVSALVALRTAVAHDMTQRFGEGDWSLTPNEADVIRQLGASRVLVARADGQVTGTVRVTAAKPWAIDSSAFTRVDVALYVFGLAVTPSARNLGIGRQLMEAVKDTARLWPAEAVWLDAFDHPAGAGPFYLKCGFREVGRTRYREMPLIYFEWPCIAAGTRSPAS